jgi:lambda family phage portal protein
MNLLKILHEVWNSPPRHGCKAEGNLTTLAFRRYDGAKVGRNYSNWFTSNASANAEIWGSLSRLRDRSRDLCRNNDYARGAIQKLVDNVVFTGIGFQAQVKQLKDKTKSDDRANYLIEAAWSEWADNPQYCHAAGELTFAEIQQLVFRSWLEVGEVFVRKVKRSFAGSPIAFALEVIEADRCAEEHNCSYQGNQVVMGVEVDNWKRPLAYWFYEDHPGDNWVSASNVSRTLKRIPASEIIHLYFRDRPGQLRGVPLLASSLLRLKNIGDYEEHEQIAAKAAACIMAFVTTPDADLLGEPGYGQEGLPADERLAPGIIRYMASGETINAFDPKRPNPNVTGFIECQLRAAGAGIGSSYEGVSNDYSKSNYSSSRLSLLQSRDRFKVLQLALISKFCRGVYGDWLEAAVMSGVLPFADYEMRPERYRAIRWTPRGWSWVDPQKEINGTIAAIKAGLTTLTEEVAKQGGDFEENIKILAREREILERYNIKLDLDSYPLAENQEEIDSLNKG